MGLDGGLACREKGCGRRLTMRSDADVFIWLNTLRQNREKHKKGFLRV